MDEKIATLAAGCFWGVEASLRCCLLKRTHSNGQLKDFSHLMQNDDTIKEWYHHGRKSTCGH